MGVEVQVLAWLTAWGPEKVKEQEQEQEQEQELELELELELGLAGPPTATTRRSTDWALVVGSKSNRALLSLT